MILVLIEKWYPILLFVDDWYAILKLWCIRTIIALFIVIIHHYSTFTPQQQQKEQKQKQHLSKQQQSVSASASVSVSTEKAKAKTTTNVVQDTIVDTTKNVQQDVVSMTNIDDSNSKIDKIHVDVDVDVDDAVPILRFEEESKNDSNNNDKIALDLDVKDTDLMTMMINLEEEEDDNDNDDDDDDDDDRNMYQKESSDDNDDYEISIKNDSSNTDRNDNKVKTTNDDTTGTSTVVSVNVVSSSVDENTNTITPINIPVTMSKKDDIKERVYRINNNKLKKTIGIKKESKETTKENETDVLVVFSNQATANHPGLQQFYYWYDIETSLYRSYTLFDKPNTTNNTDSDTTITNTSTTIDTINIDNKICPYPNSSNNRRNTDNTQIEIQVYNMYGYPIIVYWIDTKGNAVYKGIIDINDIWVHTTFINHPFTFCQINVGNDINTINEHIPIIHYITYQPIPSLNDSTTESTNNKISIQQFTICKPYLLNSITGLTYTNYCSIDDEILPYPVSKYITTVYDAIQFSLYYCIRLLPPKYYPNIWKIILKYLTKIVLYPNVAQYRQIRIANTIFSNTIWNTNTSKSTSTTCIRGLFYSIGFIETYNGYLELGISTEPLSRQRVQEISSLLLLIGRFQREHNK